MTTMSEVSLRASFSRQAAGSATLTDSLYSMVGLGEALEVGEACGVGEIEAEGLEVGEGEGVTEEVFVVA